MAGSAAPRPAIRLMDQKNSAPVYDGALFFAEDLLLWIDCFVESRDGRASASPGV